MNFSLFTNKSYLARVFRESSWVFVGQFGAILGQLFLIKFITELIPVDTFGTFSIFLIFALLVERTLMTITAGITRYYCEAYDINQLPAFWIASRNLLIRPSLLTAMAGLSLSSWFLITRQYNFFCYSLMIMIFTIFMGWNTALLGLNLAARHRRLHSILQLSEPLMRLIALVILVRFLGPSVESLLAAYLASSILIFMVVYTLTLNFICSKNLISRDILGTVSFKSSVVSWSSKMWTYSWPFSTWGVLVWLQQSSDKFSLEYGVGSDAVGYYAVLFQMGFMPMLLLSTMINSLIMPVIFKQHSLASSKLSIPRRYFQRNNLINLSIALTIFVTLVFAAFSARFHYDIMSIFIAPGYLEYSEFLPLIILGGGFTSIGQFLATKIMAAKHTKLLLFGNILYASLAIITNFYGALHYGVPGVVVAVVISSIAYVIIFSSLSAVSSSKS